MIEIPRGSNIGLSTALDNYKLNALIKIPNAHGTIVLLDFVMICQVQEIFVCL